MEGGVEGEPTDHVHVGGEPREHRVAGVEVVVHQPQRPGGKVRCEARDDLKRLVGLLAMRDAPFLRHLRRHVQAEEHGERARPPREGELHDDGENHPAVPELELRPRPGRRERVVVDACTKDVLSALGV